MKAIEVIRQEHRALSAVLHGMQSLVSEIRDRAAKPDFAVLGAMIYYIDTFPERIHHPKEDRYLFPLVRSRCPSAGALVDRLEAEHAEGARAMRSLAHAFSRYQQGGSGEFAAFTVALDRFARLEWDHMRAEESELLPLAEEHLLPDDWKTIDAAFLAHRDPLAGAGADEHRALFRRIVMLAPPPIGVGSGSHAN